MGSVKGFVVNLVVRRVRKMVPSWNLPGHMKFNAALAKGKAGILQKVALTPDDLRLPAIYGRNDRVFRRVPR